VHLPDGFLDAKTAVATGALATAGLGLALAGVRRSVPPRRIPLIGLAAAFVFAAQMLNFPVAGGTSGHLIGGVLAAVLLGPSAAVLVMSAVIILQCLIFADGGLTALGANLFNMALVAPTVGYGTYRLLRLITGKGLRGRLFATAFAAWGSTVAAAVSCAGQLAMSGTIPLRAVLPVMGGVHMLIGLGEAFITTLVIATIARARPELLIEPTAPPSPPRYGDLAAGGLLVALSLAFFVAPFASGWPDGLEWAATSLGFAHRAAARPVAGAPLADYRFPGVASLGLSTVVAGAAGTLIAFGLAWLLATLLTPSRGAGVPPGGRRVAPDAPRVD
jgi:cobalt/nickel transport system permease protein